MNRPAPTPELQLAAILDVDHPIKAGIADWARQNLDNPGVVDRDHDSEFSRADWRLCAEIGLIGSNVPISYGGSGDDFVTTMLKLEGLGLGCHDNGLSFAVISQMFTFQETLLAFGTEENHEALLPGVVSGDIIGAFAMTELESGSDAYSLATVARRDDDGYRLSGTKTYVTLGPVADVAVVFASTRPEAGSWGVSAFLVYPDRDGATFTGNRRKMGMRTTPFGDIVLDGYLAAESDRLGPEGAGVSIFTSCMNYERGGIFATQMGAAERVVLNAIERARTREQFGKPIGSFQAVGHRLVDMKVRLEAARLLMYKAACLVATGRQATMAAAMSKLATSEAVAAIALDASRIHGAQGYITEFEVERQVRDALGGLVYSGTSDIQRNVIARMMEIPQ